MHALSASLEVALLRELAEAYRTMNVSYFGRALRPPAIVLSSAASWLGRWLADTRTLEIGRRLVLEHPWTAVLEVLKHEMAHQYVDEVLGKTNERHGPVFRDVCIRRGIDPKASGLPEPATTGSPDRTDDDERVLARVARLLALAESANEHEAHAAMTAAQRLMLKYNLDAVAAQNAQKKRYAFRQLGRVSGRVQESERLLAGILGEHFFVEVIWVPAYRPAEGKRGSVLEASGTEANLEMAAYVHAFLTHTAEQLWLTHKREAAIQSNRDRQTFLAGVMLGFHEKLCNTRTVNQEQGLVWVGDAELETYYRRRHPHIRREHHAGNQRNSAREQGRRAGRDIVLHRPVSQGPSGGQKLLGPKRS